MTSFGGTAAYSAPHHVIAKPVKDHRRRCAVKNADDAAEARLHLADLTFRWVRLSDLS